MFEESGKDVYASENEEEYDFLIDGKKIRNWWKELEYKRSRLCY